MVTAIARAPRRLVTFVCFGSALFAFGCDPDAGRPPGGIVHDGDDDREELLEALEEALGEPLSQAAAHVKNEGNWVEPGADAPPADDGAPQGDDGTPQGDDGAPQDDDGGADDSGQSDDGGGEAGSCVGHCDGVGSDGACYCDAECTSNDDCCSDYAGSCGGGDDGGGADDGADAGSCSGHCDDAGTDGVCWCDDACTDNGDCCADYLDHCAAPNEAPASLGFASPRPRMSNGDACWGVVTDPVDVERLAAAASVGGALFGTTCVAVLVVPAGAGAVPTAGLSVGAAALACSTSVLGGAATGAVVDLVGQRMGNIAECSGSVMSSVLQVFGWGTGEKVEVPVYTTAPADPGNCTPDEKDQLQQEINDICKNAGSRSCSYADSCPTIAAKIDTAAQCINARQKINSQCFDGGDDGHNQQVQQEVNLQNYCYEISTAVSC